MNKTMNELNSYKGKIRQRQLYKDNNNNQTNNTQHQHQQNINKESNSIQQKLNATLYKFGQQFNRIKNRRHRVYSNSQNNKIQHKSVQNMLFLLKNNIKKQHKKRKQLLSENDINENQYYDLNDDDKNDYNNNNNNNNNKLLRKTYVNLQIPCRTKSNRYNSTHSDFYNNNKNNTNCSCNDLSLSVRLRYCNNHLNSNNMLIKNKNKIKSSNQCYGKKKISYKLVQSSPSLSISNTQFVPLGMVINNKKNNSIDSINNYKNTDKLKYRNNRKKIHPEQIKINVNNINIETAISSTSNNNNNTINNEPKLLLKKNYKKNRRQLVSKRQIQINSNNNNKDIDNKSINLRQIMLRSINNKLQKYFDTQS